MRISDWSSDVCSSDLQPPRNGDNQFVARDGAKRFIDATETDEINRQYRILIAGFAFHFRASRIDIVDKYRALRLAGQIGRASCRDRVCKSESISVADVERHKKSEPNEPSPEHITTNYKKN